MDIFHGHIMVYEMEYWWNYIEIHLYLPTTPKDCKQYYFIIVGNSGNIMGMATVMEIRKPSIISKYLKILLYIFNNGI
jgi:hypothetical protein